MIRRGILIVVAIAAALIPLSPRLVERWYSASIYPRIQHALTPLTNHVPVALLDVVVALLLVVLIGTFVTRLRGGFVRAVARTTLTVVTLAAALYLCFLALWGLNYRRVPLEEKLDFDRSRVTRESAIAFASSAARLVNEGYAAAHGAPADDVALASAFADAQRLLGAERPAVPGVPKRSVLTWYFRRAAIDGMTDPFFLEIILNTDVLAVERPFVLAHEWAHLAGYADESEANFLAWLTCARSGGIASYSGWLAAYQHTIAALPRADRAAVLPLADGPRRDLRAMSERYARSLPAVRNAARDVYDSYLKANRVQEGIASYDAVVRLFVATRFSPDWQPQLR
jgi:hypothetical protein